MNIPLSSLIEATSRKDQHIARNAAEYAYRHRDRCYTDIWQAYERPSYKKEKAWHYCQDLCIEMRGVELLISTRNTFSFSAVFTFWDENDRKAYAYITKDYERFCYAD